MRQNLTAAFFFSQNLTDHDRNDGAINQIFSLPFLPWLAYLCSKIKPLLVVYLRYLINFNDTPNNVYFHHLSLREALFNPPTYKGEGEVVTSL